MRDTGAASREVTGLHRANPQHKHRNRKDNTMARKITTRRTPITGSRRKDGFMELSWYKNVVFFATKANGGKGYDLILSGPASSGKTTAAYMLAHDLKYEIVVQQCHRRVEVEDFRGTRSIVPGKGGMPITSFDAGSLTHSVQLCEKARGVVYCIDEINLVDPAMLAILNNLTQRDAHSCLVMPELNRTYPRPDNLIIIGTMNPDYQGTNQLAEAFLSRIVILECPMMDSRELKEIMLTKFPQNPNMVEATVRVMNYIEACRKNEQHHWEPDLRTMFQFHDLWLSREPKWKRFTPWNTGQEVFEDVIGPKIGWKDSYSSIREGLCNAITTSLGRPASEESSGDITEAPDVTPNDDEEL